MVKGTSRDEAVESIIEDSKAAGDISKALEIAIEAIGAANLRDNELEKLCDEAILETLTNRIQRKEV